MEREQHLGKQRRQLVEEAFARVGDGAMVGVGVGADLAERDRVVRCLRELVAGEHPGGVGVEQKAHRHRRVVGARAAAGVSANRMAEIELVDDREHKQR